MASLNPSAHRTLQVFELFAQEQRPLSNSEIAKKLGLAESSCSDLLHTLRHAGYLMRMPGSRKFQPTSRLSKVVATYAFDDGVEEFIEAVLSLLTQATGETSMCGSLAKDKVRVLACQESPRALRYVLKPGTLLDVHATGLGKALLSDLSTNDAKEFIRNLALTNIASNTIREADVLIEQIKLGRERGYVLACNEGTDGVFAISFVGRVGDTSLAFSLVGPVNRFEANLEQYIDALLKIKDELFDQDT